MLRVVLRGVHNDDPQDVCWYYGSLARMFEILAPGPRAAELSRLAAELAGRSASVPGRIHAVCVRPRSAAGGADLW